MVTVRISGAFLSLVGSNMNATRTHRKKKKKIEKKKMDEANKNRVLSAYISPWSPGVFFFFFPQH